MHHHPHPCTTVKGVGAGWSRHIGMPCTIEGKREGERMHREEELVRSIGFLQEFLHEVMDGGIVV
jgi:hypothetical protein